MKTNIYDFPIRTKTYCKIDIPLRDFTVFDTMYIVLDNTYIPRDT